MKNEKRINRFVEVVYGLGDVLAYEIRQYHNHKTLHNINRLCSFVKQDLHDEELESVKTTLKKLRQVADESNNTMVVDYIDSHVKEFKNENTKKD